MGVQTHRAEVPMPAAQPRLHHEAESDLIERLAPDAVVESAQGDGRRIILVPERGIEEPLVKDGRKARRSAHAAMARSCPRSCGSLAWIARPTSGRSGSCPLPARKTGAAAY